MNVEYFIAKRLFTAKEKNNRYTKPILRIAILAIALSVAAQWAANFFISSTYPPMMEFSSGGTYLFYGIMSILSALFVWKMVPETKGKTLEEIEDVWKDK